jgi:hypothetical protein
MKPYTVGDRFLFKFRYKIQHIISFDLADKEVIETTRVLRFIIIIIFLKFDETRRDPADELGVYPYPL